MSFYKCPLDVDLTNVSIRDLVYVDDACYIDYNDGDICENWEEISEEVMMSIIPEWFEEPQSDSSGPSLSDLAKQISDLEAKITADKVSVTELELAIAEGVDSV